MNLDPKGKEIITCTFFFLSNFNLLQKLEMNILGEVINDMKIELQGIQNLFVCSLNVLTK